MNMMQYLLCQPRGEKCPPKYDTYLLIEVKVELAAAQYFSRSEKDLGNTKSINGNDIYPAKILAENHFSKINCLTRSRVYTN